LVSIKESKEDWKYLWLPKSGPGRPPVPENIVDLILDMKRCNPLWGKKRIRDELRFLGISLDPKTIQKILKENGMIPPPMKFAPPTWKYLFYSNRKIWSMDFFNIIDIRCFQIYFLVVTDITTRKLIHLNLTLSPNKEWLIQQFRNIAIEDIEFPDYLIIDNDGLYGKWIDVLFLEHFEMEILRIAKGKPWENGICERLIKTLKQEFLSRSFIAYSSDTRIQCRRYMDYFNQNRPHQGIDGSTPSQERKTPSQLTDFSKIRECKKLSMWMGYSQNFGLWFKSPLHLQ